MANTTSGTVTFDKTFAVDEIIEEAYERIGLQSVSGLNTNPAGASCSRVRLNKIWYNVSVTAPVDAVRLYWDADTDVQFLTLNYNGHMDFSSIGGIKNTEATGVTGDVKLTLPAVTAGDTASVHCEWIKVYA